MSISDELRVYESILDDVEHCNSFRDEPLGALDSCKTVDEVKAFKVMIEEFRINSDFYRFCNESVDFLQHCKSTLDRNGSYEDLRCLKRCEDKFKYLKGKYRNYKEWTDSKIRLKIASSCKSKLG